jgi:CheY-like chemotaxis protein
LTTFGGCATVDIRRYDTVEILQPRDVSSDDRVTIGVGNMAKTLLVVDQNLAVHRLLDFTLSKEGFEIVAVEDGLAALDRAYQGAPDLIMVSSQLNGLPLNMFVRKVREQEALRAVPIILMAQSSDDLDLEQLKRSGITDMVKKPLDAMEINATINRCCIVPHAPVAVAAEEAVEAAGMDSISASTSQNGSTEDDQNMMQMEQLLGWVPRNQTGLPTQAPEPPGPPPSAPPPPPSAPPTPPHAASAPPAPPAAESQPAEKLSEFELYDPMAESVAAPPRNGAAPAEHASMDDLLLTGSDALLYQPPVVEAPPAPPEPESSPESELPAELQELMSAQAPTSVNATERAAPPPAVSPHSPQSTPSSTGGLEEMTRDETEQLVQSMVEEMTRKVTQETVERITKELVPELTERAVRAEIERLKAE